MGARRGGDLRSRWRRRRRSPYDWTSSWTQTPRYMAGERRRVGTEEGIGRARRQQSSLGSARLPNLLFLSGQKRSGASAMMSSSMEWRSDEAQGGSNNAEIRRCHRDGSMQGQERPCMHPVLDFRIARRSLFCIASPRRYLTVAKRAFPRSLCPRASTFANDAGRSLRRRSRFAGLLLLRFTRARARASPPALPLRPAPVHTVPRRRHASIFSRRCLLFIAPRPLHRVADQESLREAPSRPTRPAGSRPPLPPRRTAQRHRHPSSQTPRAAPQPRGRHGPLPLPLLGRPLCVEGRKDRHVHQCVRARERGSCAEK